MTPPTNQRGSLHASAGRRNAMPVTPSLNNFNAGEMSPYLIGRIDLDKYGSGCQRMENFRALPYGGAVRRPGTEFVNTVIGAHRLKEFIYSTETSYVLAFGDINLKIYRNGAYLGLASDVVTPYASADVFALQFLQINDVMFITHPDYAVRKLSRVSATVFTLAEVEFDEPPFFDVNIGTTTITPSGTSGSITLAASANIFNAGHVGGYFKIQHLRAASSVSQSITANGDSAALELRGPWTIRTSGTWSATVEVQRSYNGIDWEIVASYPRESDGNVDEGGSEESTALLRISITGYTTDGGDSPLAVLTSTSEYGGGVVKITAFTDAQNVDADVVSGQSLLATTATTRWYEGSWSEFRGFPKCCGIFEERIYFANTYYEPQRIWGSRVGEYEDFLVSAEDDAAVSYAIADVQQNPIQWLLGERSLLFTTSSAQWTLSGGESGEPVTPSNVKVQRQPSNLGGEPFQPVSLPGITLFLQRGGRKFRELFFQFVESAYSAQDVTLLAEHITESGIKQFAASNHPDSIAYCVRNDGQLAVMVYERGQSNGGSGNLVAWSRYVTDGEFESVTIIPGEIEDEVWCVVARRAEGGATVRCIERFRQRLAFLGDRSDWYFLDCGRTVDVYREASITNIERVQYGAAINVDGVLYERVQYRVSSTSHGFIQGDCVRITGTEFEELNGNVYKVCRQSTGVYYLGEREEVVPSVAITNIPQNSFPLVTVAAAHQIILYGMVFVRSVGGMTNVNLNAYGAQYASTTTFNMNVDTTAFPAYTSGGFIDVLASSLQPFGWTVFSSGGGATRVTNEYNTASVLGALEQSLVVDGSPVDDVTPTDFDVPTLTGSGTSETYGSVLHAGLPYTSYLLPNPLEIALQTGASTSVKKRIAKIDVRFRNTVGAKVGPDEQNLEAIQFRATSQAMDQAVSAFSGIKTVEPKMDIVSQADILVVQDEALNCEVLAISPRAEFYP